MATYNISHAELLEHITDNSLPEVVANCADSIFKLVHDDLTKVLDKRTKVVLNKTRDGLIIKFAELCPQFPAKLARNRSASQGSKDTKHTFVQDILLLGSSIIAKAPVEHINLVYVSVPEETLSDKLPEKATMPELTEAVNKLVEISRANKCEIELLKNKNKALKMKRRTLLPRLPY